MTLGEKYAIVKFTLLDAAGRKIAIIEDKKLQEGEHAYQLNRYISGLVPGNYLLTIQVDNNVILKKLIKR